MFLIGHGPDNYEEGIELKDISFYRASWEHPTNATSGIWIVKIVLRNGYQDALRFTEKEYDNFVWAVRKLNKSKPEGIQD